MDTAYALGEARHWMDREWSHTWRSAYAAWHALTPPIHGSGPEWLQWGVIVLGVVVGVIVIHGAFRMAFVVDDSRGSRL